MHYALNQRGMGSGYLTVGDDDGHRPQHLPQRRGMRRVAEATRAPSADRCRGRALANSCSGPRLGQEPPGSPRAAVNSGQRQQDAGIERRRPRGDGQDPIERQCIARFPCEVAAVQTEIPGAMRAMTANGAT